MTSEKPTITTILCGTDGSSDAQNAVTFTAVLAEQLQAEVVLVHAIGLLEHMPVNPDNPDVTVGGWATDLLSTDWSNPLRDRSVPYRCIAEEGPPLLAIPRVADRVNADLIVVASHGQGASSILPLGSTAHGMVQLADRPIVVVPGARAEKVQAQRI